jgi:hypothetical protein
MQGDAGRLRRDRTRMAGRTESLLTGIMYQTEPSASLPPGA